MWVISLILFDCYRAKIPLLLNIIMERGTFNEGVKVKAKVNKGLCSGEKLYKINHAMINYRFENFSYELYNKLELDIKNLNFQKFANSNR